MEIERLSFAFGSSRWGDDLQALDSVLGSPTFSDGSGWAQFDVGGTRVSLGELGDVPPAALMLKVSDPVGAADELRRAGWQVGEVQSGAHETRVGAVGPGGVTVVAYAPAPRGDS